MRGCRCTRCNTTMIRSHHEEKESCAGVCLMTVHVHTRECPRCGAIVKVIFPFYPHQQLE